MRRLQRFALVIAGAVVICFALLYRADVRTPKVPADLSGSPDRSPSLPSSTILETKSNEGLLGKHKVKGRNEPGGGSSKFSVSDIRAFGEFGERFLRDRGENPFNLLAVFAATEDRKYLERALQRFPGNPAVLYLAFNHRRFEGEDRTAVIEQFKTADPLNPLPHIYSAADLFEKGRPSEAVAALKTAMERPAFYTYFNERAAALRDLALYAGATKYVAERAGFYAQAMPELDAGRDASRGLMTFVQNQRQTGGDIDLHAQVQLLYQISRMYQTPEVSRSLMGHYDGLTLEKRALEFAASLSENPLPIPLESRLAKVGELSQQARELFENPARANVDPALWDGFLARCRADGELAALQWLRQQPTHPR